MSAKELLNRAVGRKIDGAPETIAHKRAKGGWNNVLGSQAVQAKNWRLMAGVNGLIALMCSGAAWHYSHLPSPPPLVVERDSAGRTNVIGFADNANYAAKAPDYREKLGRWIQDVRSLSIDPIVVKEKWREAYAFMGPKAIAKLNAEANADGSVQKQVGQITVSVQVENVVPITPTSYEARWTQVTYNAQTGNVMDRSSWTVTFAVSQTPVASDDPKAMVNPLGITIDDFAWHRDLAVRN